jgi:hypothetical protein
MAQQSWRANHKNDAERDTRNQIGGSKAKIKRNLTADERTESRSTCANESVDAVDATE